MAHGRVRKVPKKCNVIFEWPLNSKCCFICAEEFYNCNRSDLKIVHRRYVRGKKSLNKYKDNELGLFLQCVSGIWSKPWLKKQDDYF